MVAKLASRIALVSTLVVVFFSGTISLVEPPRVLAQDCGYCGQIHCGCPSLYMGMYLCAYWCQCPNPCEQYCEYCYI
jgi:hypothetical protein